MSNFLSNIANKAQNALNQTPLGQHVAIGSQSNANAGEIAQNGSNQNQSPGGSGFLKSHTFESISHQFRTLQQQYTSTSAVQKIITTQKGIALDLDSASRDSLAYSKELYLWSHTEEEDLEDVTDRLAWLNYVQGSLVHELATKLNASRTHFKALRDAENGLVARHNIRANFQAQIGRIEHEQQHGMEQKLAELKKQLAKAEADDGPLEREVEILKRKAVRDGESAKWEAFREYGEKLILLSQAASAIIPVLPPVPPSETDPYAGADTTASVRAVLQHALDTYRPGETVLNLRPATGAPDLKRSDTRSFGMTHATELARINGDDPGSQTSAVPGNGSTSGGGRIPITPPATQHPLPPFAPSHYSNAHTNPFNSPPVKPSWSPPPGTQSMATRPVQVQSPPLNPATLNQAPAPIPILPASSGTFPSGSPTTHAPAPAAVIAPDPADPGMKVPMVTPTVAETGVPKMAGPEGPGPASGSLKDLKEMRDSPPFAARAGAGGPAQVGAGGEELPGYEYKGERHMESAEEEKRRLERLERERVLAAGGSAYLPPGQGPSGSGSGGKGTEGDGGDGGDGELPPYREF